MRDEVELKFKIKKSGVNYLRSQLQKLALFQSSTFEIMVMFDNKEMALNKLDARLRLKLSRNLIDNSQSAELSYKRLRTRGEVKVEEEIETRVESYNETYSLLKKIGFYPVSSYERFRETYRYGDLTLTLDIFPLGIYLEIEGERKKITKIAQKLGFNLKNNLTESCDTLDDMERKKRKMPSVDHIVFKDNIRRIIEKSQKEEAQNALVKK
jgi:predicted adenylyl cyclase CyaB